MKNLGEDGGGLVSVTLDGRHLGMLVDVTEKRILTDLTELLAESNQLRGCELLTGERDDFVLQPAGSNLRYQIIRQRLIQLHANNGCPATRARRLDGQTHWVAPISGPIFESLNVNGMVPPGQIRISPQVKLVGPRGSMLL